MTIATSPTAPPSLEAKVVILGSQGVGKTSLVHRYVSNAFIPPSKCQCTVGASFLTTRVIDPESGSTIRLQMWDTAGSERFRSISRLYYRGAHAAIVCYDVTSRKSWEDMGVWLKELRDNCGSEVIVHVVGTKMDIVAAEPQTRAVPFETCMAYVAEHLHPGTLGTVFSPPTPATMQTGGANSNRSSGFWGGDAILDCCHEVSAKDGEGIDEIFRIITRKLVEQHSRKIEQEKLLESNPQSRGRTPGLDGSGGVNGYFDLPNNRQGSFRLGMGDKRMSWLGALTPGGLTSYSDDTEIDAEVAKGLRKGRCC